MDFCVFCFIPLEIVKLFLRSINFTLIIRVKKNSYLKNKSCREVLEHCSYSMSYCNGGNISFVQTHTIYNTNSEHEPWTSVNKKVINISSSAVKNVASYVNTRGNLGNGRGGDYMGTL